MARTTTRSEGSDPELSISPEKAFFILVRAREFEAETEPSGLEEGSNPADDREVAVLEEPEEDGPAQELQTALEDLNEDELVDVLALTWLGRGDYDVSEWEAARAAAAGQRDPHIPLYLVRTPLFSDYLEEGLGLLGHDLDEFERAHL